MPNPILKQPVGQSIDLFGPSVEFLTSPYDRQGGFCELRGTIPPGGAAPPHSHDDVGDFCVISGEVLALRKGAHGYESIASKVGDYIRMLSGVPHGWRNVSSGPFVTPIITTPTLGKFFPEAGRPLEQAPQPPTSNDFARLAEVSAKYGCCNAAPERNAAVGIRL
jgi:quercetin dioxygenase-like cupin family protein